MSRVGFEPTISAGERPKTYALDRAATGTGCIYTDTLYITIIVVFLTAFSTRVSLLSSGWLFKRNLLRCTVTCI